ncbi:Zn-ribbon-containing, possibly RNA-binding protein and truncated derivatives [Pseudoalteromonas luteoviolacea B = ATCC 29581]|nr:Zn-ribbon-containing, possibly RNA-binding protein and truncated derivatives [Pseudoalteromonas luteoviolacea B = ATCC 29581]
MAKNRYAPKALDEVVQGLSVGDKLKRFASSNGQQTQLQAAINEALGPILCKKCRVSHYREGTVFLEAASSTLATRLQYMKMEMLSSVRNAGFPDCVQIKISSNPEVQTRLAVREKMTPYTSTTFQSTRTMSQQTAHQLEAIAEHAPDSLKEKLLKLAKHAKK